jgi:hypothetical protein
MKRRYSSVARLRKAGILKELEDSEDPIETAAAFG